MPDLSPELAEKRDRLLELISGLGSCAVAFSGGVDSTVVAKAAHLALRFPRDRGHRHKREPCLR